MIKARLGILRNLIASGMLVALGLLASASPAPAATSLTGETLTWSATPFNGNFACSGGSHFSYSLDSGGVAAGPYSGTFTGFGTVTVDVGQVVGWTGHFRITDASGSVVASGTETLASGGGGPAGCVPSVGGSPTPGSGSASATLNYSATMGADTDSGVVISTLTYVMHGDDPSGSSFHQSFGPADTSPPSSVASESPASSAGWHNGPVTVTITASDPDGASDVAEIHFSAAGAQTIAPSVAAGNSTSVSISAEGVTAIAFFARDLAGNTEPAQTFYVRIDETQPTISFTGNVGKYQVDEVVDITCSATDPATNGPASGINPAMTSCTNIDGPAYSFGLGPTIFAANAADVAGNSTSAAGTFFVSVSPSSLCNLTLQMVESSLQYQSLPFNYQAVVRQAVRGLCTWLDIAAGARTDRAKTLALNVYKAGVAILLGGKLLTTQQAAILTGLTSGI